MTPSRYFDDKNVTTPSRYFDDKNVTTSRYYDDSTSIEEDMEKDRQSSLSQMRASVSVKDIAKLFETSTKFDELTGKSQILINLNYPAEIH